MNVDGMPIPAATPVAPSPIPPPSPPVASNFSATLASSMSNSAPASSSQSPPETPAQSVVAATAANFGVNTDAQVEGSTKLDTTVVSKPGSGAAQTQVSSGSSLTSLQLKAKSAEKPGGKPDDKSDGRPGNGPRTALSLPAPAPTATVALPSTYVLDAYSLTTLVIPTPATLHGATPTSNPVPGSVSDLGDILPKQPHAGQQLFSQQIFSRQIMAELPMADPAGVTAASPPMPQMVASPASIIGAGNCAPSATQGAPSFKDQLGATATIAATSAAALATSSFADAFRASNFSTAIDAGPSHSSATTQANSQVPAEVKPPSLDLPAANGLADSAAAQPPNAPSPGFPVTSQLSASRVPAPQMFSGAVSSATASQTPAQPAPITPSAPAPAESHSPAAITTSTPTCAIIFELPTDQAPIAMAQAAAQQIQKTAPATPAIIPVAPLGGDNPVTLAEPPIRKQPTPAQSSDSAINNSTPENSAPDEFALFDLATTNLANLGQAPRSGATSNPAPVQALPPEANAADVTTAPPQTAGGTETGFSAANLTNNTAHNIVSNGVTSDTSNNVSSPASDLAAANPTPNFSAPASSLAAIVGTTSAATASDEASNAKADTSAQQVSAAAATNAVDKKSSTGLQTNSTPASVTTSQATSTQTSPAAPAVMKDVSPALSAIATPASPPSSQASSDPAPALPQAHQMLDSAPPPAGPPPPAAIAPGSAADVRADGQLNAQMHVGIRTDAFGLVEIHTVVEQSQVGITVHSDRDIARWFSSEVPSLESGLSNSHLNLTGVHFDSGRSGVQTASSFQHGQPRQHAPETPAPVSANLRGLASPEQDTTAGSATVGFLPAEPFFGPAATRFSIHA